MASARNIRAFMIRDQTQMKLVHETKLRVYDAALSL
jgi:hypothetical protein